MTKEEAINSFKKSNELTKINIEVHRHIMDTSDVRELEWYIERDKMAIEALEQGPTGWIPVSERLPEEDGYYITTTLYREVYCDYWNGETFERTEEVIAWMQKPEPYKGSEG